MTNQKNTVLEEMKKRYVKKISNDLENLSNEAINLISGLLLEGFTPKQIKELMTDREYLDYWGIPSKFSFEVYSFLCDNWEAIQKIGV